MWCRKIYHKDRNVYLASCMVAVAILKFMRGTHCLRCLRQSHPKLFQRPLDIIVWFRCKRTVKMKHSIRYFINMYGRVKFELVLGLYCYFLSQSYNPFVLKNNALNWLLGTCFSSFLKWFYLIEKNVIQQTKNATTKQNVYLLSAWWNCIIFCFWFC